MGLEPSVEALIQLREELLRAGVPLRELPEIVRKAAEAGADFGEMFLADMEQILSPDNITGIFTRAFTGGGGVMGALKGIGTQLAGALSNAFLSPLTKSISEGLTSLVGGLVGGSGGGGGGLLGGAMSAAGSQAAGAFMGGSSAAAGGAAGGGLAGGISGGASTLMGTFMSVASAIPVWGWAAAGGVAAFMFFKGFGGPSKAELKGRETADAFHKSLAARANENQTQEALLAGWDDPEFAKTWIVIRDTFRDAGKSIQEADEYWHRWREAIVEGGEAVEVVQQELIDLMATNEDVAAAAEEAAADVAEAAEKAADRMHDSMVQMWMQARDAAKRAAQDAYDKARKMGASHEEAAATGTRAWEAAYDEHARMRIEEMAREASLAAALTAIREGNADEAVAIATAAYNKVKAEALLAFGRGRAGGCRIWKHCQYDGHHVW